MVGSVETAQQTSFAVINCHMARAVAFALSGIRRRWAVEVYILYVDASTKGWRAVLFDEKSGEVRETGGPWEKRIEAHQIPVHETKAVGFAMEAFAHVWRSERGRVVILTDSTSAQGALLKGGSPSFEMNFEVRKSLVSQSSGLGRCDRLCCY